MLIQQASDNNLDIIKGAATLLTAVLALIFLLTTGNFALFDEANLPANIVRDYRIGTVVICTAFTLAAVVFGLWNYPKSRKRSIKLSIAFVAIGLISLLTFNYLKVDHVVRAEYCSDDPPVIVPFRYQFDDYVLGAIRDARNTGISGSDATAIADMLCESDRTSLRERLEAQYMPMTAILVGLMLLASSMIFVGLTLLLLAAVAIKKKEAT